MKKEFFLCPVCGFDRLQEPVVDNQGNPSYEICPCCGFEFGFENTTRESYQQYRTQWIREGAVWFVSTVQPSDWDLQKQLQNLANDS